MIPYSHFDNFNSYYLAYYASRSYLHSVRFTPQYALLTLPLSMNCCFVIDTDVNTDAHSDTYLVSGEN